MENKIKEGQDRYMEVSGGASSQHPHPSHVRRHVPFPEDGADNCLLQHSCALEQHSESSQ